MQYRACFPHSSAPSMASVLASVPSVVAVTMSQSPAPAANTYASAAAKEKSPSPRSSTRRLPSPSGGAFGSFEALGSFAFCFASSSAFSLFFVFLLMNLCLLPPDFLSRMLFAPGIVGEVVAARWLRRGQAGASGRLEGRKLPADTLRAYCRPTCRIILVRGAHGIAFLVYFPCPAAAKQPFESRRAWRVAVGHNKTRGH